MIVVDGGDRACGELLLVLAGRARGLPADSPVRLIATDPAAAIDLPAWCHLTGHHFAGRGVLADDGRPYYDVVTSASGRRSDPARPWRLAPATAVPSEQESDNREEHP
ncbi:sulfurtransferase TusA family protein [Nocardioides donggukensis]|uniref:Sulfurtransferase TusA family protein n=1 Tax=Nocardioides donggukensis TaxID=2774019 RepID=A0A927KBC5_9ACTN|nr:sulfurtransferase TusA family protein [Nocardioides donggukensis]MBD8871060.1 sulfurtransferase TusA family protein [Nocardioides donggukensis]